jgi:HPr kinase/phosphorylase
MRDPADEPDSILLHGTTVAVGGAGLLITGAAGSGKSALALMLMA